MSKYRENPLITPFSMLCPGISQNTQHHHLTLYKGQVWGEKSYLELCNHNVLNIVYDWSANANSAKYPIEQNGKLYVPTVPGRRFLNDATNIPWDSEILQSFSELTNITNITFHSYDIYEDSLVGVTWQLEVGNYICVDLDGNHEQCVSPHSYIPWYIWTKEGFKIQIKIFCQKTNSDFQYFHNLVSTTRISDSKSLRII